MKKILALCCAVMITGCTLTTPFITYQVMAADTAVSNIEEGAGPTEDSGTDSLVSSQETPDSDDPVSDDEFTQTEADSSSEDEAEEAVSGDPSAETEESVFSEDSSEEGNGDSAENLEEARAELAELLEDHIVMALVYLSDTYPIRAEASYEGEVVAEVPSGQQVLIQDMTRDESGTPWEYVTLSYQGTEYSGYIPREYLACSDELFLAWEEQYGTATAPVSPGMRMMRAAAASYKDIDQFPESYQAKLTALKQAHPKWTFVPMNTGLDWKTVIDNEMGEKSLVPNYFADDMKNGASNENGWSRASRKAVEKYMDPRNWLDEESIFQFEQLTYNETYHTQAAVQKFLDGTFMKGKAPGGGKTYAQIFFEVGKKLKVSPFHLASRVKQEQGQGGSGLISGNYSGYKGYYNYFNIDASGDSDQEIISKGLACAKKEGWNTPEKSIEGGARVISSNYILNGQDTLYLQKFDVDDNGSLYWHQYMQNICAPSSEGQMIYDLYEGAGSLDNTFVFKIPVYKNMPSSGSSKPTTPNYNVSLTRPSGYSGATVYLDGVAYNASESGGKLTVKAPNGNYKSAVMYQYNSSGIPTGMYVWTLSHNGSKYTVTAEPELQDMLTYEGFAVRITGKSGIRFTTGISKDLRARLLNGSVSGYTLKEYGTLCMNNAYIDQNALVKGGKKVASGLSYGYDANGNWYNSVLRERNGWYHYASVLVGLPADQYKTKFAFRGFVTLTKNGQQVTIYGPVMAKSIYSVSQQLIDGQYYPVGGSTDLFLKKIIKDGDNA